MRCEHDMFIIWTPNEGANLNVELCRKLKPNGFILLLQTCHKGKYGDIQRVSQVLEPNKEKLEQTGKKLIMHVGNGHHWCLYISDNVL